MPELPDLVHVERKLREVLPGRRVAAARTGDPTVLRIMVTDPFPDLLVGRAFATVERRGHFMCLGLDGDLMVAINCMLTGRFQLAAPDNRGPQSGPPDWGGKGKAAQSLAVALLLEPAKAGDPALELRYLDEKRMGKVYVVPRARLDEVPVLGRLGLDLLSEGFTLEAFRKIARKRRDQVRQFLMDKTALASIGNAYADEILFAAKLHPKTFTNKLAPEDIDRLYQAIVDVTRAAIEEIRRRDEPIEVKVRDFLAVRGRDGKPCPACGTTIRSVRVGDGDACFCPKCQPATRALFVDWSKLPRDPK
jgi:formamidopyrimidine-DNA glycosylase